MIIYCPFNITNDMHRKARQIDPRELLENTKIHAAFLANFSYQPDDHEAPTSMEEVVKTLAFIYNLHRFNLLHYELCNRNGITLSTFPLLRNFLVHASFELISNSKLIMQTQQQLQFYFSSFETMTSILKNKNNDHWIMKTMLWGLIKDSDQNYDERLKANEKIDDDIFDEWMRNIIVPFINILGAHQKKIDPINNVSDEECDAALKMVVIIFGEYCNENRTKRFKRKYPDNMEVDSFIKIAWLLRNRRSHEVIEEKNLLLQGIVDNAFEISQSTTLPEISSEMFKPHAISQTKTLLVAPGSNIHSLFNESNKEKDKDKDKDKELSQSFQFSYLG